MGAPARRQFSFREYLELEEASNTKHEYYRGEIYAMAGGTPAHAALSMSIGATLLAAARKHSCRVYSSDLRIRVPQTGLTTYPDVTVLCGPPVADPESATTLVNPTVVVEVLSPSTEEYDREEKIQHCRQIPSLRACVLVGHDQRRIEVWSRAENGDWQYRRYGPGERAWVAAVDASVEVDALYDEADVA